MNKHTTPEQAATGHGHDSFEHSCPKCGLAPRQIQPLVPWGFEFLTEYIAPCHCGGAPVQISGGIPRTFKYYCQQRCGMETAEYSSLPEAVYDWNCQQIAKGFDARQLHPLNNSNAKKA